MKSMVCVVVEVRPVSKPRAAVPSVRRMLWTAFRAALIRRRLGLPAAD